MSFVQDLKNKVLSGDILTEEEAYSLLDADTDELFEAAAEVNSKMLPREFDSCSIINARSGRCSENCKWCAQSAHFNTNCKEYDIVDRDTCLAHAKYNHGKGVKRFSLVTSGKAVKGKSLDSICALLEEVGNTGIGTCCSLGLLGREELEKIYATGTHRYHCNLETAPSYFGKLCTTHTIDDKLRTIAYARELGFEICSGGIIGMGESRRQRVEFALTLRKAQPTSIPINILSPIKGTPLENTPLISEEEVLETIAMFRMIHPTVILRFAGGRARLSEETQIKAMRLGITGGIVSDLLTTLGSQIDEDRGRVAKAGLKF